MCEKSFRLLPVLRKWRASGACRLLPVLRKWRASAATHRCAAGAVCSAPTCSCCAEKAGRALVAGWRASLAKLALRADKRVWVEGGEGVGMQRAAAAGAQGAALRTAGQDRHALAEVLPAIGLYKPCGRIMLGKRA